MRKLTKGAIAVGAATTLALGGGIAWAAWSSTGSGSGSATSTVSANSHITSDTTGNPLYPGASTTFTVKIDNPNSYPVVVTSISDGKSNATGAAGACAAGSVTSAAVTSPGGTIAAGGSATYTLTAHMDPNAPDACQGQTFTLPLTATLQSNAS